MQRAGSSGDAATGDDAVKLSRDQRKRYMRDYRSFLWPFKRTFVIVFVLALLSAALSMIPPLATRYIVDRVLPGADMTTDEKWSQILLLCGAVVLLLFLMQAFDTARAGESRRAGRVRRPSSRNKDRAGPARAAPESHTVSRRLRSQIQQPYPAAFTDYQRRHVLSDGCVRIHDTRY